MSAKGADYHQRMTDFMVEEVFPAEKSAIVRRCRFHDARF